jgi:hypothetical protein
VLTAIKLLHTVIWAFLAASILALPVVGVLRRFRWAAILTVVVLLECGLLAVNGGRCPLSDLASRFTLDRNPNFDIYLPGWFAEHNKVVFGWFFVAGELVAIGNWLRGKFGTSIRTAKRRSPRSQRKRVPIAVTESQFQSRVFHEHDNNPDDSCSSAAVK